MIVEAAICLAMNVYHEARGEPFQGQVAVAQVNLRRADFQMDRVCSELLRPHQFTWTHEQTMTFLKSHEFRMAAKAAEYAIVWAQHGTGNDYSKGADHYHNLDVNPTWNRCATVTTTINRHRYYKDVVPCKRGKR